MLFRNKNIFLLLSLFGIANSVVAQYKGGSANGGDNEILILSACAPPENTNIYFGGDTNGANTLFLSQTSCSVPINFNIYLGGNENGASSIKFFAGAPCSPPENLSIFFGGIGGKSIQSLISCSPPESTEIYYGGSANGVSSHHLINCPVASPVNIFTGGINAGYFYEKHEQSVCTPPININIFFGGINEGYFIGELTQTVCSTPENTNIFMGGTDDGFEINTLTQSVCPAPENFTISLGGDSDGMETRSFAQSVCPPSENYSISIGGNSDGYSIQSLTQSICAMPENTFIFIGGNADGEDFRKLEQAICGTPQNINVFLGGNDDGFGIGILTQQVCPPPVNLNIFKGGVSDGFELNKLSQSGCSSPENSNVYFGGISNGYEEELSISCIQPEPALMYFGGSGNGTSSANISICPINTYIVNIYTGGNANGASTQKIIQTVCVTAENQNIYFGGSANGVSNFIKINTVCPVPENTNIYLGGVANGSSIFRNIQTLCPTPENLNIYSGGHANGASYNAYNPSTCPLPINQNIFFGGVADGYATRSLIQPNYWTGSVNQNWHEPFNWSLEAVPDISMLAIITNVPNFPIISNAPAVAKSIVMQTSTRLDISRDVTTEFSFTNDGTVNITGSPIITVGGDLHCENGVITTGNAKFIFNAATGIQTVNFNNSTVNNIEITTTGGASCQLEGNLVILQNIVITSGTLNANSYNIALDGNWTNSGTFTPGTGTVTFKGVSQTITNSSGENFYNFILQNYSNLTLSNNIQVSNNLTLTSGNIIVGSNVLTIGTSVGSPGNLIYSSGRIIGRVEKWIASTGNFLFPIGTFSNSLELNLDINSGLTSGSVLVYFVSSNPGNGGLPISESGDIVDYQYPEGYWNITAKNGFAVGDYSISLAANGFITYYFNPNTKILKRTSIGPWHFDGSHVAASSPNCYRNNLSGGISTLSTQFGIGYTSCSGGSILDDYNILPNENVPAFVNSDLANGGADLFTYTWQFTTNTTAIPGDTNWTDIPSSNVNAYDYGTLAATTRFVRKAVSVGCINPVYSNVLLVSVNNCPVTGPLYHIPNNWGY